MNDTIAHAVAAITADYTSGAVEIAEQASQILLHYAQTSTVATSETLRSDLVGIGWAMIKAHPTMAPLVNLVNITLKRIDGPQANENVRQCIVECANDFRRQLRVHEAAIAELTLALIPDGAQIVTLGRSTTVRAAMQHAQRAGRRFSVVCAEGRPGLEGRAMVAELADAGIAVTLVVDTLAIAMARDTHLVLVGADHLSREALVNKVGTYGLALAAQNGDVPVYALCSSHKFLPPDYVPPPQAHWPGDQIWSEHRDNVVVENVYFDYTPLSQINGVVTEQGVLSPAGIEAWLATTQLHAALNQAFP